MGEARAEDDAPSALPSRFGTSATSGRTDGRIEVDPGLPTGKRDLADDPDVRSAVVALAANAVNRNRLSMSSDRQAIAERVAALVESGYTTKEIIEAWADAQHVCELEGRLPRFYPQLYRWLGEVAPTALEKARKSRAAPGAGKSTRPEWLDRTIRYNELLSTDSNFADLVDELRQLRQENRFGCATERDVDEAQARVDDYFDKHEADVA